MEIRQAVLLVGGRGTRLWPLTATAPKALISVAGLPFVEFQLRMLAEAGIVEAWLAIGTDHEHAWQDFVAGWTGEPSLKLSIEDEPLDTAGPVMELRGSLDDRFLVLNGDVALDASLIEFIETAPSAGIVLGLVEVEDPSAYGVVVVGNDGVVERFVEKPSPGAAPANSVNAGIYLVEGRVFEGFEPGPLSFERRVFPELAIRKELGAVVLEGRWLDIGTPQLYLDTHEAVLNDGCRLYRPPDSHGTGPGASVHGDRQGSWSWIGNDAVVDAGAVIREAVVLDRARIHSGAQVSRAVVGWESEVLPGASVTGEVLIGRGALIGPGCELTVGMRIADGVKLGPRAITFSPPQ